MNPELSAQTQLHEAFDYNAISLALSDTEIIIHEKLAVRSNCTTIFLDEWYIGGATKHHRCNEVYVNQTAQTKISDTVYFFSHS